MNLANLRAELFTADELEQDPSVLLTIILDDKEKVQYKTLGRDFDGYLKIFTSIERFRANYVDRLPRDILEEGITTRAYREAYPAYMEDAVANNHDRFDEAYIDFLTAESTFNT